MTHSREGMLACGRLMVGEVCPGKMIHSREGMLACSRLMVGEVGPGRDDPL